MTIFGTSAAYIARLHEGRGRARRRAATSRRLRASARPARRCRPRASTGSTSTSAPTRGCSRRAAAPTSARRSSAACPTLPVYEGELQARALGAAVEAFDEDGRALIGEVGELVITEPMPSMPISFWDDDDGSRLRESYFDDVPRRLAPRRLDRDHRARHGDHLRPLGLDDQPRRRPHGHERDLPRGARRSTTWSTRSSSTSRARAPTAGCRSSSCCARAPSSTTTSSRAIRARIREDCSPRHVPNEVHEVAEVPRTLSGKVARGAGQADPHGPARPTRRPAATRSPTPRRSTTSSGSPSAGSARGRDRPRLRRRGAPGPPGPRRRGLGARARARRRSSASSGSSRRSTPSASSSPSARSSRPTRPTRAGAAGDARPLLGVPVAIKDDADVAGEVTALRDARRTAARRRATPTSCARLRAAGAIVVGKTNVPELTIWPFTEIADLRRHAQPVVARPHAGRLERRLGRGGRRRALRRRARLRRRAARSASRRPSAALFGLKPQRDRISLGPERPRPGTASCAPRPARSARRRRRALPRRRGRRGRRLRAGGGAAPGPAAGRGLDDGARRARSPSSAPSSAARSTRRPSCCGSLGHDVDERELDYGPTAGSRRHRALPARHPRRRRRR